jgi:hypothetical protein
LIGNRLRQMLHVGCQWTGGFLQSVY